MKNRYIEEEDFEELWSLLSWDLPAHKPHHLIGTARPNARKHRAKATQTMPRIFA